MIKIKRIYEPWNLDDGFRILVDRLWPRGMSKEKAKIDLWMKEIAPSNELRKWFSHDLSKWDDFKRCYKVELENKSDLLKKIMDIKKENSVITLLYSAKDKEHNNAVVLEDILKDY